MTEARTRRHRAIAQLLRSQALASQEEVLEQLRQTGFEVTQATVSRDLDQLGAVKVRRNGRVTYAMPEDASSSGRNESRLNTIVREWVRSAEAVGNLIVIRTPPGSAHLIGVALDEARLPTIAGTICGDDTIFVALREPASAPALVGWLSGEQPLP